MTQTLTGLPSRRPPAGLIIRHFARRVHLRRSTAEAARTHYVMVFDQNSSVRARRECKRIYQQTVTSPRA